MNTKRSTLAVAAVALVVLLSTVAWNAVAGNGNEYEKSILRGAGLEWSPVGTWVVTAPTPMGVLKILHVVHAQDSSGKRYGGVLKDITADPTLFGTFPEADGGGDFWASQTARTGPDSLESTILYYATKKSEGPIAEIAYIAIMKATWRLTGPNTNEGECTLAAYLAEQDADGDGFPDEGQEPVVCMPFTYTSRRLTMMPGCVPTGG